MTVHTMAPGKHATGSLEPLFRPRGIAIAGASADATKPGHQVLNNLLEAGYPGHIAVIHPNATAVLGVPAYPALDHVPGPVEMLILAVPAKTTPEMVEAIGLRARMRKDLKVVVALAGGFGETGTPEGIALQEQLAEGCRAAGVRLVGPNCVGVVDNKNRVDTTFLTGVWRRFGGVSLLSQSGAMGAWMALEWGAQPVPIGLNKFISLGNLADVDMAEMMEYLGKDTSTRAIGLYLEGSPDARRLLEAAGRVTARKPVVVLKVGRTGQGSDAARSHTGALAGTDAIYDGAFRQYGLIRMQRLDDFIVTLNAFDKLPMPLGSRVALLTNAGGPGVYALDCLADAGLSLGKFSPATKTTLSGLLPPYAAIGHPDGHVDMTGGVTAKQVAQSVAAALRDPGLDALIHLFIPTKFTSAEEVARELLQLLPGLKRHSLDKPYLPVLLAGHGAAAARRLLEENGVVTFGSPDQAAAALAALVRYSIDRQPPTMEAAVDGRTLG
ncbi:MAG TPA: CoA-binding protein [Symbiobacteriaceae bacterium]|nr:CoA-binding protein [Symbiobacteriaceae bacterium]